MTRQVINVGTTADDYTGDLSRTAFQKCNANFSEVYTGWTVTNATAQLNVNKGGSGQQQRIMGLTAGTARWAMSLGNETAESGGNAGSDFGFIRYSDAGAGVDWPLTITRSNGSTNVNNASVGTLNTNTGSMTTSYFGSTGDCQVDANFTTNNTLSAYNVNGGNSTIYGNLQVNGDINSNTIHCQNFYCSGQTATNTIYCSGGGWLYVSYMQAVYIGVVYNWADGNPFAFGWQTQAASRVSVYVNNSVIYAMGNAYSDRRLKQGITTSTYDCVATLKKIPRYQFHWQDHSTPGQPKLRQAKATQHVPNGLVAQRLYEVAPHLVIKGGYLPNQEGNPFAPWQIDVPNMFALLVGAIQQLTSRVEALEQGT